MCVFQDDCSLTQEETFMGLVNSLCYSKLNEVCAPIADHK
jgi:hypothetical protein